MSPRCFQNIRFVAFSFLDSSPLSHATVTQQKNNFYTSHLLHLNSDFFFSDHGSQKENVHYGSSSRIYVDGHNDSRPSSTLHVSIPLYIVPIRNVVHRILSYPICTTTSKYLPRRMHSSNRRSTIHRDPFQNPISWRQNLSKIQTHYLYPSKSRKQFGS